MIQNIRFPEGTVVKYQRGSFYDQFNANIDIGNPGFTNQGAYAYSQLYSARVLDISHSGYCYSSNCHYKVPKTMSLSNAFYYGVYYYDIVFDKSTKVSMRQTLKSAKTKYIMTVSGNFSDIYNFSESTPIKFLYWDVDTSELISSYFAPCFYYNLVALYGIFSIKSASNISRNSLTGYSRCNVRQFTVADIGYNKSQTSVDFSYWDWWGYNHTVAPDARQSLIDSLITYSFDRATAGYSNCAITLSAKTKALLTEEEIAQITAKGFTIA